MALTESEELEMLQLQKQKSLAVQQPVQQVQAPQQEGFGQRVGEDLAGRAATIKSAQEARESGEQGFVETGLQQAAQAGLGVTDVIGEAAVSGFRALPDVIEDPLRAAGGAVAGAVGKLPSFGGGTIGEGLPGELGQISQTLEQHPRAARNLAIAEAATLASPVKVPGTGALRGATDLTGKSFEKIGGAIIGAGKDQIAKQKAGLAFELIAPIESRKFLEQANASGRVVESPILKKRIVEPTDREVKTAEVLGELNIKPNQSFSANNRVVIGGIDTKATELIKRLNETKVIFPKGEVKARLNAAMTQLVETNPFLVGNAELTAARVSKIVNDAIDNNLSTPAGLLKARKEFDRALKSQTRQASGKTIFDSDADRAVSAAIREIRGVVNSIIAEKAPNVDVRRLLGEQELLFGARDVISAKAAQEGSNAIRRIVDRIPLKSDMAKILGVGAVTGGAIALPTAAGVVAGGLATKQAIKGLRGPTVKKALGQVLRNVDKAIRAEKDAGVLRQLRADKVIVLELFKQETE